MSVLVSASKGDPLTKSTPFAIQLSDKDWLVTFVREIGIAETRRMTAAEFVAMVLVEANLTHQCPRTPLVIESFNSGPSNGYLGKRILRLGFRLWQRGNQGSIWFWQFEPRRNCGKSLWM